MKPIRGVAVSTLEEIEAAIETLPPAGFKKLCDGMREIEADAWDREIEADSLSGKWDHLADQALEDFRQGRCTPL